MPRYVLRCKNTSNVFEGFARMGCHSEILCPCCDQSGHEIDYANQGPPLVGNREFHGKAQESLTEGFHPSEVGEARKLFGDCCTITGDGTVKFKDRSEQRKYAKRVKDIREQNEAKAAVSATNGVTVSS